MSNFKLLIVEDSQKEIDENFLPTLSRFSTQQQIVIEHETALSLDDAMERLDDTYDGVTLDLKLIRPDGTGSDSGNDVIREIHAKYRIPIAVVTATPLDVDEEFTPLVKVFLRDNGLDAPLEYLLHIYSIGLTKIMGGRGKIETAMNQIFWTNIIPHIDAWTVHVEVENIESVLLRHVVSHIHELLEDDGHALPQEMYVSPPISATLRTGSILKKKDVDEYSVVLSPPCDLIIRASGKCKTDKILICDIENFEVVKNNALNGIMNSSKRKSRLEKILKNSETEYYHWLPKTSVFAGGVVNFRWVSSLDPDKVNDLYETPVTQIAAPFIKDLLSRFSGYYARQGQPDFDVKKLAEEIEQA